MRLTAYPYFSPTGPPRQHLRSVGGIRTGDFLHFIRISAPFPLNLPNSVRNFERKETVPAFPECPITAQVTGRANGKFSSPLTILSGSLVIRFPAGSPHDGPGREILQRLPVFFEVRPAPGYRNNASGALNNVGNNGYSWSSTVAASGYNAHNLNFNTQGLNPTNTNNRANGLQVRCLQVFIVQGRFFFCPVLPVTRLIYNRNTGGFAGIFSICATLDGYKPATPGIVNILYRIGYSDYVNSGDYIRLYPKSGSDLHKPALRCRSALEPGIFREGARAEKTPAKT